MYIPVSRRKQKTPHCLVCTVVQDTDKAEGYVFRDIKNVIVDNGLPGNKTGMPVQANDDKHTVAQLYGFVKEVNRSDGGIKYSPAEKATYGFHYTKRNDGVLYSERTSHAKAALDHFGTTSDYDIAGFVTAEGRMLKLGQTGFKGVQHKKIEIGTEPP